MDLTLDLPKYGKWEDIARLLMRTLLYDNGGVNRWLPDGEDRYPDILTIKIKAACEVFFTINPSVYTKEDIDNICCGELEENQVKYGILKGYDELDELLNEFFDSPES